MEKAFRRQLRASVVKAACSLYAVNYKATIVLPSFQNGVILACSSQPAFVLRFSHYPRRDEYQILAELEWMAFLKANGVIVPASLPSARGNLVEEISTGEGERFLVCALEYLRGRSLGRTVLTNATVARWGQLAGTIHRLSTRYSPSSKNLCRPAWYSEENYAIEAFAPPDANLRQALNSITAEIHGLSNHSATYGLLHGDIQPDNLLLMESGLGIFDFDGSVYSWYLHDIATALFSVLPLNQCLQSRTEFASRFLLSFLRGYQKENELDLTLLEHINAFLKLEEMGEYLLARRSEQPHRLLVGTGRASISEWTSALVNREPLVLPLGPDLLPC